MPTPTLRLHRVLRAPSERVCRAFLDADALAKRLPPDGYTFGFTRWTRVLAAVSRDAFLAATARKTRRARNRRAAPATQMTKM